MKTMFVINVWSIRRIRGLFDGEKLRAGQRNSDDRLRNHKNVTLRRVLFRRQVSEIVEKHNLTSFFFHSALIARVTMSEIDPYYNCYDLWHDCGWGKKKIKTRWLRLYTLILINTYFASRNAFDKTNCIYTLQLFILT